MRKIRDILLKYPIKYTFFGIILVTTLLSGSVLILIDINTTTSMIKREKLEESVITSDNIFQLSEYLLNKGDIFTLQKILTTYSGYTDIDEINITDEKKRVILSTKRSNIGNVENITNFESCKYVSSSEIICHYTIESKEKFHLLIRYDISGYLKDYFIFMAKKYTTFAFIFFLSIWFINVIFSRVIGKNIDKIINYLKETKSGIKLKPLHIYGKNELSTIADSITDAYKRLWELINLDRLTKIPNRFYLEKEFSKHKNHISKVKFLAIIDLDNFKELNDFFGHDFGDRVLMEFAKKLENICEGYSYICGRLGGDEFLVFGCEEDSSKIEKNISNIFNRISGHYRIGDVSFYLTVTIGVSVRNKETHEDFYSMLKEADIALYKMKEKGKNKYYILSKEEREEEEKKKRLYSELTLATENRELFMVYQPIVDYRTGQIISYESLVRWNSRSFGLVSPGDFIPYLETTGEIIKVGKYIIQEVTEAIPLIKKPIHVNISSKQLFEKDFADFVNNLLKEKGINSDMLYIEITETQDIPKDPIVFENLSKLSNFGIRTSLDDFGTGYSNLYTISQIKPKSIKIDIFLIRNIDKDTTSLNIVKAIKNMADAVGLEVIAEGVESKQIADILDEIGIHIMQGYYFSKPLKLEEILKG